uniref:Uncharacterized protein n=1 Tax=Rhizophora mucronata TaxID=61149 RepID=A0A2P2NVE4_RHIMU
MSTRVCQKKSAGTKGTKFKKS